MTDRAQRPGLTLPTARPTPFDPPAELGRIRNDEPVAQLAFPDGRLGWLVTDHATARAVLSDPRFSNRLELRHLPFDAVRAHERPKPPEPGFFPQMDPPAHTRYRRLLVGQFTARRMRRLEPEVLRIVGNRLDAMAAAGPPVDLVQMYALPIPSMVICELLGVPYADRATFQDNASTMTRLSSTGTQIDQAFRAIQAYLRELVAGRRAAEGTAGDGDLIGALIRTGELTEQEIANIATALLLAGFVTLVNMLALGTYCLLAHPEQLARLRAEPDLVDGAVEELLRYLTVVQFGTNRTALEDVELNGRTVRAGEPISISLPAANRDPSQFADPETLDITASASRHLAFGHGLHQCLGQQLARLEMRIGYRELFRRFPDLTLATAPEAIPLRTDMAIYGVHRLDVAW